VKFYKIRESFFLPQSEEIEVSLKLDKKEQTFYNRHHVHLLYYCFGYLCYLGYLVTKVTTVYMVAMATLAPCLPKLPLFTGGYSNIKEPEGLCSAYISYHVDQPQNKILLLKRRQEMSAGRNPSSAFTQPQQPVNNGNISNHGNNGNSDNQHYHGNKTI
jgi:hypothetical protein